MLAARAALGAAAIVGGLLLPFRVAVQPVPPPVSACTQAVQAYGRLAAGEPAGVLARAYEVAVGGTVYGPVTGLPVPWAEVDRWAGDHPEAGVGFCDPNGGYTLVGLSVRSGWAYILITPEGQIAKIYLSEHPLAWD